jgi:hypothetical protein
MNQLEWLQDYYLSCCNGDWEHTHGVKVDTLDNPGWVITIDLEDTVVENTPFKKINWNTNDEDWGDCEVINKIFKGYGGSKNLEDLILVFRKWVEENERLNGVINVGRITPPKS